jgi:hypothetical protein
MKHAQNKVQKSRESSGATYAMYLPQGENTGLALAVRASPDIFEAQRRTPSIWARAGCSGTLHKKTEVSVLHAMSFG